jgi:tetratricopeptide (TPR) repeat protein
MRRALCSLPLFLFAVPQASAQQVDRFALVIGITYPAIRWGADTLRYANRDAIEFAKFLKSPQGGSFPPGNVKLLVDAAATRRAIGDSIDALRAQLTPGALLYVFFSGHTWQDADNYAYVMPYDGEKDRPGNKGWRVDEFQKMLKRVGAGYFVLFLDACHAGAVTTEGLTADEGLAKGGSDLATVLVSAWNRALASVKSQDGVIFSSSASQSSFEDPDRQHGVFSYYLLRGLRGAADSIESANRDGKVTVGELMAFLTDSVPPRTRVVTKGRKNQIPAMTQALSAVFPLTVYNQAVSVSFTGPGGLRNLFTAAADARRHFDEGYRLGELKDHVGAVREYRAALFLDPNYAWARNNLGVSLEGLGDSAGAMAAFRETFRRTPSHALSRANLANHLLRRGDTVQAISLLREAIARDPGGAHAYHLMGAMFLERKQYDSARTYLSDAYRRDSTDAFSWHKYGQAYAATGDPDLAVLWEAWGLGVAWRNLGRYTPENLKYLAETLARQYEVVHDREAAIKILERAVRADTAYRYGAMYRDRLKDSVAKLRDSVRAYQARLKTNSNDEVTFRSLHGALHEELLDAPEALSAINDWLAHNPASAWARADRAENLYTAGRYAEAETALNALLAEPQLDPSERIALLAVSIANDIALVRSRSGKAKLAQIEQIVAAQPDSFAVSWVFYGTRAVLRTSRTLDETQRFGLLALVGAISRPSRAAILTRLRDVKSSKPFLE